MLLFQSDKNKSHHHSANIHPFIHGINSRIQQQQQQFIY